MVQQIPENLRPFAPISAAPKCALNQIILCFNRELDWSTANLLTQYTVTGPGSPVVTAVSFNPVFPQRQVVLTLSGPLTASSTYTVTATGVKDLCGNSVQSGAFTKFKANQTVPRLVLAEPDCNNNQVIVNYDRPMGASAEAVANYNLVGVGNPLSAVLLEIGRAHV